MKADQAKYLFTVYLQLKCIYQKFNLLTAVSKWNTGIGIIFLVHNNNNVMIFLFAGVCVF